MTESAFLHIPSPLSPIRSAGPARRVLLLITSQTYRAGAFLQAGRRLGVEVVVGVDMQKSLADYWRFPLGLDFTDPDGAVTAVQAYARERPLDAILAVDDSGSLTAARASAALGLPHNSYEAAMAARDKHRMRTLLAAAGVPCPPFQRFTTDQDGQAVAAQLTYPCVLKPLNLNGSRGVMRADDAAEFVAALQRLQAILTRTDPTAAAHPYLVEQFVPGFEVAVEGILDRGRLRVLALFDKPDPLDGPYFEETLYVTPSRLPAATQAAIEACTAAAAAALGLQMGPVHAELRVNADGPWVVEVAGRSIGGLCSQTLRFELDRSLEELILGQACGLGLPAPQLQQPASGVMMIPIPGAGILRGVSGLEAAQQVEGVTDIEITAKVNYSIAPLPEGESYLGFIFARAETPAQVETALRAAHGRLSFQISPEIPLWGA